MKHGNRTSSKTGGFILGQESLSGGLVYQFICQCCHFAHHITFLKWLKGQNARISSWVSSFSPCKTDLKLVGGLEQKMNVFFHIIIGIIIIPTYFHIFQRGRYTTNQYLSAVRFSQFLWVTSNNPDAHGAAGHRRARRGLGQLALRTQKCRRDTNRGCIPSGNWTKKGGKSHKSTILNG